MTGPLHLTRGERRLRRRRNRIRTAGSSRGRSGLLPLHGVGLADSGRGVAAPRHPLRPLLADSQDRPAPGPRSAHDQRALHRGRQGEPALRAHRRRRRADVERHQRPRRARRAQGGRHHRRWRLVRGQRLYRHLSAADQDARFVRQRRAVRGSRATNSIPTARGSISATAAPKATSTSPAKARSAMSRRPGSASSITAPRSFSPATPICYLEPQPKKAAPQ